MLTLSPCINIYKYIIGSNTQNYKKLFLYFIQLSYIKKIIPIKIARMCRKEKYVIYNPLKTIRVKGKLITILTIAIEDKKILLR